MQMQRAQINVSTHDERKDSVQLKQNRFSINYFCTCCITFVCVLYLGFFGQVIYITYQFLGGVGRWLWIGGGVITIVKCKMLDPFPAVPIVRLTINLCRNKKNNNLIKIVYHIMIINTIYELNLYVSNSVVIHV